MRVALGVVFTIILLSVFLVFTFSNDYILKREVAPNVYDYYTYNSLDTNTDKQHYNLARLPNNKYMVSIVYDTPLVDFLINIDYVFTIGQRLSSGIVMTGRIQPVGFADENGRMQGFENALNITIYSQDLVYGGRADTDYQYVVHYLKGYECDINTFTALSALSLTGEYFYQFLTSTAPDFENIDSFLDGVVAGLTVLVFPLITITGFVKSVAVFFAFFGGGFLL